MFLSLSFVGAVLSPSLVLADTYTQQIQNLQNKNNSTQQTVGSLQLQAQTYQSTLDQLSAQISLIESQITTTENNINTIKLQIAANQAKLVSEKNSLSSLLESMYVDGHMTTLESLATSNNMSDFVTKIEYQNMVQQQIQGSLTTINATQVTLNEQNANLNKSLSDEQYQNAQLASAQQQQVTLLAYNQQQQDAYTQQIQANNSQIATLQAEEAAALAANTGSGGSSPVGAAIKYKNMTSPVSCGGGYSYCWTTYLDQPVSDPWGFGYARECVHYALDYLQRNGYIIPYFPPGEGNALNWVSITTHASSATRATLDASPEPGDVVYMPIAPLGHVGIVDWVNSDGTVHVSQYNWYPGEYNEMDLYVTSGIQFLKFQKA
jgi:peptidoglycan hydrolase CwlO-like protein